MVLQPKARYFTSGPRLVFKAMIQQAYELRPKSILSSKVVCFMTTTLAFFVYQSYSATLTSLLANDKLEHEVTNLKVCF